MSAEPEPAGNGLHAATAAAEAAIIDITAPITDGMVVWPGDAPVTIRRLASLENGDEYTVSELQLGSHTGTHVDAPVHFLAGTACVHQLPLSALVGTVAVISVVDEVDVITATLLRATGLWPPPPPDGGSARASATEGAPGPTRVLFQTRNSATDWARQPFQERYVHLSPDAAAFLVAAGVRLVGIDYLSVDAYTPAGAEAEAEAAPGAGAATSAASGATAAPVHMILLGAGVVILEGLYMPRALVQPGSSYELLCLPLLLHGCDGAPTRALLRRLY
jgi:arylformamidase